MGKKERTLLRDVSKMCVCVCEKKNELSRWLVEPSMTNVMRRKMGQDRKRVVRRKKKKKKREKGNYEKKEKKIWDMKVERRSIEIYIYISLQSLVLHRVRVRERHSVLKSVKICLDNFALLKSRSWQSACIHCNNNNKNKIKIIKIKNKN